MILVLKMETIVVLPQVIVLADIFQLATESLLETIVREAAEFLHATLEVATFLRMTSQRLMKFLSRYNEGESRVVSE
jgi:hypothetical protein